MFDLKAYASCGTEWYWFTNLLIHLTVSGYDVFLGNFRGLVSREHVDKSISSRQ